MVTVKVHWLVLPLLSRAVFVTVVVPNGNVEPLGGRATKLVTAQLSVAVTVNDTCLEQSPGGALNVRFAGQLSTGGCVSVTVTVKVHWLVLPPLSRAVLVTVVVPTGNAKPLGGSVTKLVTAQLSLTVTLKVTLLTQPPGVASTVMFPGQAMAGGSVSSMVTAFEQVPIQPVESVTWRVRLKEPIAPALTITDELSDGPTIVPSPEIDQT